MRNSDIKYFLHKSLLYDHLKDTFVFRHIDTHDYLEYNRFYNYLHDEYKNVKHEIKSIAVEATIKGKEQYQTTLDNCSCPDFKRMPYPKEPCKHMYMLAYELALLNSLPFEDIKKELALATHKYLKAKQQAKTTTINSHEYCERNTIEYAIEKLINEDDLMKIVKSYNGDIRIRALAEHFNVTEDFMNKAVEYYFGG